MPTARVLSISGGSAQRILELMAFVLETSSELITDLLVLGSIPVTSSCLHGLLLLRGLAPSIARTVIKKRGHVLQALLGALGVAQHLRRVASPGLCHERGSLARVPSWILALELPFLLQQVKNDSLSLGGLIE